MSKSIQSILFALIVAVLCSLLLTAATIGLKPRQIQNAILDKQTNILKAVGLVDDNQTYSRETIEKMYQAFIQQVTVDQNGMKQSDHSNGLPLYLYIKGDVIQGYIIPINTKGLWGPIEGYLAIQNDGTTISGFTVVGHQETPGLGGEIEKKWFQKNFINKKIVDQEGHFTAITVAKGSLKDTIPNEKQAHYVDGISGATLTGAFLSKGFKEILANYESISIKFRQHSFRIQTQ